MRRIQDSGVMAVPVGREPAWLEEGLIWRGPEPPEGPWDARDWVEIPCDHHLAIPKARLTDVLAAQPRAKAAGERFLHLLQLVEALFHHRHHTTLNQLKDDYQYFNIEGGEKARVGVSNAELRLRERRFLANFLQAMALGNYLPFSEADYQRAFEQDYLLDVPVQLNWEKHDPRLLEDFYRDAATRASLQKALGITGSVREYLRVPAEIGDNALVFYRGIGRDRTEGRFFIQKLNLIVERLFSPVVRPVQWLMKVLRGAPEPRRLADSPASETVFERRWLRRVNLRNQPLFASLFRKSLLQEPTLRQMVLLFRLRPKPKGLAGWRGKATAGGDIDWTIRLKMFRQIPLADSEIVFPEKLVRMRSFDQALLLVTFLAAVPALMQSFAMGGKAVIAVGVAVLMVVGKVIGQYLRVRREYVARMTQDLYDKNLDNNVGVLQYLVDSLEEQELKEAVLAYCTLYEHGGALTEIELDGRAERFLCENFEGREVDFEVGDALHKVVEVENGGEFVLPIVTREEADGQVRYRAKPLDEALRVLDERWDNLFKYNVQAPPRDGSRDVRSED